MDMWRSGEFSIQTWFIPLEDFASNTTLFSKRDSFKHLVTITHFAQKYILKISLAMACTCTYLSTKNYKISFTFTPYRIFITRAYNSDDLLIR